MSGTSGLGGDENADSMEVGYSEATPVITMQQQIETERGRSKLTVRADANDLEHWKQVAAFLRPLTANAAFCEMMNEGARVMVERVLPTMRAAGPEDACQIALRLGFRVTPSGEISGPIPVTTAANSEGERTFLFAGVAVTVAQLAAVQMYGPGALARGINYRNGHAADPRPANIALAR